MSEFAKRDIEERLLGCLRFDEPNDLETEIERAARDAAIEISLLRTIVRDVREYERQWRTGTISSNEAMQEIAAAIRARQ